MKSILKMAVASALVANSALAVTFVAGGSAGILSNNVKVENDIKDFNIKLSSAYFGLEGGAIFDLTDSFAMSSEVFLGFNTLNQDINPDLNENKIKKGMSFGVQTRGIYSMTETTKLYGKLGFGMMQMSFEADNMNNDTKEKISKNSVFAQLGLGAEFMMMDGISMFTEFDYTMPFSKLEDKAKFQNVKVKMPHYGVKVGVRYFF